MLITDIKRAIEQVSREKGIDTEFLITTLKEAVESAARKKLGPRADIEVNYNEGTGEIEVFQFKEVVEAVEDPEMELSIEEGEEYDPDCDIGDSLGLKVDTSEFGRIAAQSAKQVIIQKMKKAERNVIYENFIHKKGSIINGIVMRIDRGNVIVNLGQAEAVLLAREQIQKEKYRRGDRIRAYVLDVLEEARDAQIILSRTHPEFIVKLFVTEVPEISEGIVTITGSAREPGVRSKIAVSSSDPDVDPVGACVGMKGNRVQSIVQELRGEKIDIVPWNPDIAKFVCNALAPAEIAKVIIDEDNKSMDVIVVDDYLSIAIGRNGQNVRLACKLTGWHLEVMSEKEYSGKLKQGYDSLMTIPGVSLAIAESLYNNGFCSLRDISEADAGDICSLTDFSQREVEELIKNAREMKKNLHRVSAESGGTEPEKCKTDIPSENNEPAESKKAVAPEIIVSEDKIENETETAKPEIANNNRDALHLEDDEPEAKESFEQ